MPTKIEWATESWNPITGCSHAGSPGCDHCYAKRMAQRLKGRYGYPEDDPFRVTFHPDRLDQPLKWKKPKRIFVCSMSDLFHEDVKNDWIRSILFTMFAGGRHHTYIILTKRPERMYEFFMHHRPDYWPLPNVIGMVTAENQEQADKRIPILLECPFAKYGVSLEPLLGEIDLKLHGYAKSCNCRSVRRVFLRWIIVGGESGAGARPMHPDWARSIREQCQSARVPFFFKQWGEWCSVIDSGTHHSPFVFKNKKHDFEDGETVFRFGKKKAGRILDGRTWDEMPDIKQKVTI